VPQGKVKWFSTEKAYGFIAQENDSDIFVHVTGLAEGVTALETDQLVEFEVTQGRKGNQAANVRPASAAAAPPSAPESEEAPEAEEVAEEIVAEEVAEEIVAEEVAEEIVAEEVAEEIEAEEVVEAPASDDSPESAE
jgi:CspA family cold shock protein